MGVASGGGARLGPEVSKKLFVALKNTFVGGILAKVGVSSVSEDEFEVEDSLSILNRFVQCIIILLSSLFESVVSLSI